MCGGERWAARCAAPTGYPQGVFFRKGRTPAEPCSGRPQGSPLRGKTDRERWFGKLRRSCEIAVAAIFANPGPSGPEEIAETTPFLRAGNIAKPNRYASTVMGSGESGPMGTKCPTAASPAAFWVISLVPPGEAQRSGFAGKRRSKGTSAVFATRRKRSRVDFATTSRRGQSNSPPAGGETPPSTL